MAETLKFSCSDGVVVDADKEVMRYESGLVYNLFDTVADTNGGTIPVPCSSRHLEKVIRYCQVHHEWCREKDLPWMISEGRVSPLKNPGTLDLVLQTSQKTPEELKFDEGMFTASVLKELATYDWEKIISLHEVAKYMDIRFLQELTEALIIRAPSREFLEMVSPWVVYNSLEAYRNHHVEACRNLEVTIK